ncbi:hypothetical protein RUM43_008852 [Polyplax serrata]|uniref:Uncharacterized protein n=1 Tax=Polyplax serrata TaxID=468196 RepID=A0AAN8S449_POLSC
MAELQETGKVDVQSNYTVGNNSDPKNMQELTQYKFHVNLIFLNENSLDEMGNRIDDLEKNIADLMTQAGVDGPDK